MRSKLKFSGLLGLAFMVSLASPAAAQNSMAFAPFPALKSPQPLYSTQPMPNAPLSSISDADEVDGIGMPNGIYHRLKRFCRRHPEKKICQPKLCSTPSCHRVSF